MKVAKASHHVVLEPPVSCDEGEGVVEVHSRNDHFHNTNIGTTT